MSLRSQIERVAELNAPRGVLITVDEISLRAANDLALFTSEIQHAIREDVEIAFVGAGLHDAIADLLTEAGLTFLRRAERTRVGLLSPEEVSSAIRTPVEMAGRRIDDDALDLAMRAAQGYPFLAQLIGDLAWKEQPERPTITRADVSAAYPRARRKMGANIHARSLAELSVTDRTLLAHMSLSDGPSAVADLRHALGVSKQHLNAYRQRLIDAGLIQSTARGELDFAVPYLRDYLREHTDINAAGQVSPARDYPPPPPIDDET